MGAGKGEYESEPVRVVDKLPPGLKALSVEGGMVKPGEARLTPVSTCELQDESEGEAQSVACQMTGAGSQFTVGAAVRGDRSARVGRDRTDRANRRERSDRVRGWRGAQDDLAPNPTISDETTPFGFEDYELTPENEGGIGRYAGRLASVSDDVHGRSEPGRAVPHGGVGFPGGRESGGWCAARCERQVPAGT